MVRYDEYTETLDQSFDESNVSIYMYIMFLCEYMCAVYKLRTLRHIR